MKKESAIFENDNLLFYRMPIERKQSVINIIEALQDERNDTNFQHRLYQRHCEILKEKTVNLKKYPKTKVKECYKYFLLYLKESLQETEENDWITKNYTIREMIKNINTLLKRAKNIK